MHVYLPSVSGNRDSTNAREFGKLWAAALWQERTQCILDERLVEAAEWSAKDYAQRNYAGHTDSLGRSPNQRVRAYSYQLPWFYSVDGNNVESMCVWWKNAAEALQRLYESPWHYPHVSGHDTFFRIHTYYGVGSAAGAWYVLITAPPES